MNIISLERESLGMDVRFSAIEALGNLICYPVADQDPEIIAEKLRDADIILANKTRLNRDTLKYASHLRLIAEMATGFDNIDLTYCREKGIAVANVPDYSTEAVAQHTFALALALLGNLPYYNGYVENGEYSRQGNFTNFSRPVLEIAGRTWGVAGLGHIGRRVAEIASAFGAKVLVYSTSGRKIAGYEQADFDNFLSRSDIISLHCPLTERTRHLIDAAALQKMKDTAYLINVSRGKVVDETALAAALLNKEIAGAGIDVHEQEPLPADHPLLAVHDPGRLILTPHMAWASVEARQRDADITAENIRGFLRGERVNRVD